TAWFWREAQLWSPKLSQATFNQAARDRLREHVAYTHGASDAIQAVDRINDKIDFANDFGMFRLHATLTELCCDNATISRLISWFWRASKNWSVGSQAEFDAIACAELRSAVERIARNTEIVQRHTPAVKTGLKRSIPAKLRSDKFL